MSLNPANDNDKRQAKWIILLKRRQWDGLGSPWKRRQWDG